MNRLIFAATLWLTAEDVLQLNNAFKHEGGKDALFRMLLLARKELTGDSRLVRTILRSCPYELEVSGKPFPPDESDI